MADQLGSRWIRSGCGRLSQCDTRAIGAIDPRTRRTGRRAATQTTEMKRPQAGFTMTELLVVFSVVSVVAALLMAALARGRHHRDAGQCISNIRQLADA